jgi:hypothetical protein
MVKITWSRHRSCATARIVHDSRASDDMKRKRRRVYQTRIVGCIAQR